MRWKVKTKKLNTRCKGKKINAIAILLLFATLRFGKIRTNAIESARRALGAAGGANIAPVQNKPMVRLVHILWLKVLYQLFFGRQGRGRFFGEAQPRTYPKHMRVYRHIGLIINNRGDDVRCFAPHAG